MGLTQVNDSLIKRFGRPVTIERGLETVTLTATSSRFRENGSEGSIIQEQLVYRILDAEIRDTPLVKPGQKDRLIDNGVKRTIDEAEEVWLHGEIEAWRLKVSG